MSDKANTVLDKPSTVQDKPSTVVGKHDLAQDVDRPCMPDMGGEGVAGKTGEDTAAVEPRMGGGGVAGGSEESHAPTCCTRGLMHGACAWLHGRLTMTDDK